jgi:GNAT superfamily N-acetyltransferase
MLIYKATSNDIRSIQEVAFTTWPVTFNEILSAKQIHYMLKLMYSVDSLNFQMKANHQFILANNPAVGFASFELHFKQTKRTKLHKLYVLPSEQGKQIGLTLLNEVEIQAKKASNTSVSLNVNRFNKALKFYQKQGYNIIGEEDIDIGQGFLMQDFILEKKLD